MAAERGGDTGHFSAARRRAWARDDRDFRDQYGGIFDKNAVRVLRQRRQPLEPAPEGLQLGGVLPVPTPGTGAVDGDALKMRELAARERVCHFSDKGNHIAGSWLPGPAQSTPRPTRQSWNGPLW